MRPSPTTIASRTYGEAFSSFSISDGEMFLPPAVMMMSFIRSVIFRCVPSTHSPTSPVRSHPSSVEDLGGRLRLAPVAGEHAGVAGQDLAGRFVDAHLAPGCASPTVPSRTRPGRLPVATAVFSVIP